MSEGYFVLPTQEELELAHHGILGQRWGFRRYQNPDGSLTPAGRARYGTIENLRTVQRAKAESDAYKIRTKTRIRAQKEEDKRQAKLIKQQNKEEIKTAKKLQRIKDKSKARDRDNRDNRDYRNFDNRQQNNPGQSYQNQGQQQKKPSFGSKVIKNAKDLGITNMIMDVGGSTLKRYAFKKLDEAMMSPMEKNAREYNAKLREIVAKNNLTTARIDDKALRDSYKHYDDWDLSKSKDHKNTWQNLRGGYQYQPDYQKYESDLRRKKDDRR